MYFSKFRGRPAGLGTLSTYFFSNDCSFSAFFCACSTAFSDLRTRLANGADAKASVSQGWGTDARNAGGG
ncbi:MAG: hypothetical protein AAF639_19965 [Chloroflexota bacterium]